MVAGMTSNLKSAHAWVVDGYMKFKVTIHRACSCTSYATSNIRYHEYMHCNWGWTGKCNGYFNLGIFNTAKVQMYDESDLGYSNGNDNYDFWMRMVVYDNPNK